MIDVESGGRRALPHGAPRGVKGRRSAGSADATVRWIVRGAATMLLVGVVAARSFSQAPAGAPAVIVLTYDDGMDTHLDHAIPDLERSGFRGTFFLQGNTFGRRLDEWRAAAARGHELGNHSIFHPCPQAEFDWVRPDYASEVYSVYRIADELRAMNATLQAVDGHPAHSYAYPCSRQTAGGRSYVDTLRALGFVTFARTGSEERPYVRPGEPVDPFRVPSFEVAEDSGVEPLIAFVNGVAETGGLALLMFHGVGGQWIQVDREVHQALLRHLAAHPDRFRVATFSEAMALVDSE